WERGISEIVGALGQLEDRFTVTLMLTGDPALISQMATKIEPLGDRIVIVPPVPMTEVSTAINKFDLEIMFFPPIRRNLEFALPNKLFEAVQGRLGLIIGASPMMAELVRKYSNGVIVEGWEPGDLASAIN